MSREYYRFRGDLFQVNYNFEQSAALISEVDNKIEVAGVFRTSQDLSALIWTSEDHIKNKYISYPTNYDYSGVKLSFKANFSGYVQDYSNIKSEQSLTIVKNNGENLYAALGFCSTTSPGSTQITWTGANQYLGQKWLKWGSINATWTKDGKIGTCIEKRDYMVDYVRGVISVCPESTVPYDAIVKISYEYSNFDKYIIDFDNLKTTLSPYTAETIEPTDIEKIFFSFIPNNYNPNAEKRANANEEEYSVVFSDITVINGNLEAENPEMSLNGYSIAEDYDSVYNYCPRRLAREMRKLGYSGIVDLYIGASHFYCKGAPANSIIEGYTDMFLDPSKGINIAFSKWLESYCKNIYLNDVEDIVISVSLENLQMPKEWRQKLYNGQDGETGWQPPTNFYSLTNMDVRNYIRNISNECLEIVDTTGLNKIFQFGEPWWWCQQFEGGNVNVPIPASPLAVYDSTTQAKFKVDMGYEMPIYSSSIFTMDETSTQVANWLNEQLQDYSNFMKSIAEANGAKFAVLYYPPSTLSDNTPEFVKAVNTPFNAWNNNQLDYLELEDYGWVTSNSPQHQEVYQFGQQTLGYPTSKQQYFAGYLDNPSDAAEEWRLIFEAAQEAKEKGFANVFIWSGTQLRQYDIDGVEFVPSDNTSDTNNPTHCTACDSEYIIGADQAKALANAGYKIVGRTLNGANPLTLDEINDIASAGLNIVPIYLSSMNITGDMHWNTQQGTLDAVNAARLASKLGFPESATIYFSADYYNNQADLDYIVLPYFKGVNAQYTLDNTEYKIGIYAPRNACLATENAGYTEFSFIEDAANIQHGNTGFSMPNNWAFNQISAGEIAGIGYNNDSVSGRDNGSNLVLNGWKLINGNTYYYENGIPVKGWRVIDDIISYFDENTGALQTNTTIDGYELDSCGVLVWNQKLIDIFNELNMSANSGDFYDIENGFAINYMGGIKITNAQKKFFDSLEHTENFTEKSLLHVYLGETKKNDSGEIDEIAGYHFKDSPNPFLDIFGTPVKYRNNILRVKLRCRGFNGWKDSSMYPDGWTKQDPIDAANAVLKNGKITERVDGKIIREGIYKEVVIKVVSTRSGKIITVYPTYDQNDTGLPEVIPEYYKNKDPENNNDNETPEKIIKKIDSNIPDINDDDPDIIE